MGFFDSMKSVAGGMAKQQARREVEVLRKIKREAERRGDYSKAAAAQDKIDRLQAKFLD